MGSALACHSDPAEGHSFRGSAGDTAACGLDGSFPLSPSARLCGQGFPSGMCVPGTGKKVGWGAPWEEVPADGAAGRRADRLACAQ